MPVRKSIPTKVGPIRVFDSSFALGDNMHVMCFIPGVDMATLPPTFFPRLAHLFNKAYEAGVAEGNRERTNAPVGYEVKDRMRGQAPEKLYAVARLTGGSVKSSKRGVPHLVIDGYWSVCWFGKTRVYRVWQGYATPGNMKVCDCATPEEVAEVITRAREHAAIRAEAGMESPVDAREVC